MTPKRITIAIDGHSSTGKSTMAKMLAKRIGYAYVDTGAMYRAVTLFALRNGLIKRGKVDEAALKEHLVSIIAAIGFVRKAMVKQQQAMGKDKGVVMDGRDIGTVVFPDAEMKVFATASAQVRAQRRFDELRAKGDTTTTLEEVLANVTERDRIDSTRKESPLRQADDAVVLDNSHMSFEQQDEWLYNLYLSRSGQ